MFAVLNTDTQTVVQTFAYGQQGSQNGRGVYNEVEDAAFALYEFASNYPDYQYSIVPATYVATPVIEVAGITPLLLWEVDEEFDATEDTWELVPQDEVWS